MGERATRPRCSSQSAGIGWIDLRTEIVESIGLVGEQLSLTSEDGNEEYEAPRGRFELPRCKAPSAFEADAFPD